MNKYFQPHTLIPLGLAIMIYNYLFVSDCTTSFEKIRNIRGVEKCDGSNIIYFISILIILIALGQIIKQFTRKHH